MVNRSGKRRNGLSASSASSAASPASSNGKSNESIDSKEGETTAEFRRLVVQEQVRSLRRRLWRAFLNEDAATALRAYKATARDLQAWIREEIEQAEEKEELRLQDELEKKEVQRPTMMKKLGLGSMMHSSSSAKKKQQGMGDSSLSRIYPMSRRRRSDNDFAEKPRESSLVLKTKMPLPSTPAPTTPPSPSEVEIIMSTSNKEGNENPLLRLHMNPSDPFMLDDYKDPSFEIDHVSGEARSVASMSEPGDNCLATPNNQTQHAHTGKQFKSFRKQKSFTPQQQPRTPTTSFWAMLKLGPRNAREAASVASQPSAETSEGFDPSESTSPGVSTTNPNDLQTIVLTDRKMTTPLHEAARLGSAELVRLMLQHPFVEPNFKNGQKRTALHMVSGGWTEPEERLWRTLQQKLKAKLNHKKKLAGSLKIDTIQADIGISAPLPIEITTQEASDLDSGLGGAKKAALAMTKFFHTTFSGKPREDNSKSKKKNLTSGEAHGYLVWDEQQWNQMKTERMDCLLAILTWSHPDDGTVSAGEGASVNAVDCQGRTALHYAAELGREDICMAVLSSFGAMLTVVDDSARTPCELAAEQNHPDLAAQLEARALLYSDPYGMDDELLAAVMAGQQLPDDDELDMSESENVAVVKARLSLVAPFLWFRTLNMNDIDKERRRRLADCCKGMMSHVKAMEEENELKKVMYSMKDDLEEGESDIRAAANGESESAKYEGDKNEVETSDVSGEERKEAKKVATTEGGNVDKVRKLEECNAHLNQRTGDAVNPPGVTQETSEAAPKPSAQKSGGNAPEQAERGEELASPASLSVSSDAVNEEDDCNLSDSDLLSLKSMQTAHVAQFLSRHGWIVEKALVAFADRPMKAVKDAGVPLDAILRAKKRSRSKSEDKNEDSISSSVCLICFDEFDIADGGNWTHLVNCSHAFCNTCLGEYLIDCAQSRSTGLSVPCPHHECVIPLSQAQIKSLAPNHETFAKLQETSNDNFIAVASDIRFCTHPGCVGIVKATISPEMKKWGIDFEQLACTGAVCTAVHEAGEVPEFEVAGFGPPPMTYEGVVDLNTTKAKSVCPPKSAHRFCFGCGEPTHHFPVTCETLEQWKTKMDDEVEQLKEEGEMPQVAEDYGDIAQKLWMKANTRPCPKCKAPIEKNEGCNHMTCFNPQCKHEFCWICRKDWKLHNTATGGFFRCNRWQDEDNHDFYDSPPPPDQVAVAAATGDAASDEVMNNPEVMAQTYGTAMHETRIAWKKSKEMKRFLHHYTRWSAHMESARLEKMMSKNVCTRLAPVIEAAAEYTCDANFNFEGKGLSFVHAAFKELLECRSVLQHSYSYSFFKFESLAMKRMRHGKRLWNEKVAFEQMQSELEIITEQMSDIVARSHLRATQTQILFLTVGASERRNEFGNLIFTLINEEKKRMQSEASRPVRITGQIAAAAPLDAATSTLSIRGIARQGEGSGHDGNAARAVETHQQDMQETVREALLTSLDTFMANTEDQNTVVEHVDGETENDDFVEDDEDDDNQFTSWACSACTYMNSTGRRCAMCGTPLGS